MSKTTNKSQLQMLLNMMEDQQDIACGFHKRSKEELALFWQRVEHQFNSSGPPSKTIMEWKKVWTDQKKYVRAKAAMNIKARKGTGGGPNKEQTFSDFEQAVYNLVGMKESVEGIAATTFGLNDSERISNKENFEPPNKVTSIPLDFLPQEELTEMEIEMLYEQPMPTNEPQCSSSRPQAGISQHRTTASEAFDKEIIIQKELSESVKSLVEEVKEIRRNTTRIYRALDKIHDSQEKNYKDMLKTKKEKLEEMKRHNMAIEDLRIREIEDRIEYNRRLLEIEELKQEMLK